MLDWARMWIWWCPEGHFSDTLGGMCRKVICRECGKPSWAGCGAHIESVLGDVPKADRCRCDEATLVPNSAPKKSFLSSLFGR